MRVYVYSSENAVIVASVQYSTGLLPMQLIKIFVGFAAHFFYVICVRLTYGLAAKRFLSECLTRFNYFVYVWLK